MSSPGCTDRSRSVKPTGTVDFTTTVASGASVATEAITDSTELVSKKLATGS